MRRHPWLATLVITRPVLGPNGLDLLEQVLRLLASCPASLAAKLGAFAMLNAVTVLFAQNELGGGPGAGRNAAYRAHALQAGQHPRLAELLAADASGHAATGPAGAGPPEGGTPDGGAPDRYPDIVARVLTGLLAGRQQ